MEEKSFPICPFSETCQFPFFTKLHNSGLKRLPKIYDNFNFSWYSSSYFSISVGLISYIEVIIDSFLSLERYSKWKSSIFTQATDFSSQAKNAQKCYCCRFVDIQTQSFLKLSASILPTRSQSITFFVVKNRKILRWMFEKSFLHLFVGKSWNMLALAVTTVMFQKIGAWEPSLTFFSQ